MKIYDENNEVIKDNHDNHHRSLEEIIQERKLKKERAEKVKTSVFSSVVIAVIMAIATIVVEALTKGG